MVLRLTFGQGRQNEFKSGTAHRGLGVSLSGGRGQSPLKLVLFSKMRLEFVKQIDGTIITKVLIRSRS